MLNLALHMSDPQGWNGYTYARNNPLRYVDPNGEDYRVCEVDGSGKEFNCGIVEDDRAFEQYVQGMGWTMNRGKLTDKDGNVVGTAHWFDPKAMQTLSLAGQLASPAADLLTTGMRLFGYIAAPVPMAIADYASGIDQSGVNLAMAIIPGGLDDILIGTNILRLGRGTHAAAMYEKAGGFAGAVADLNKLEGGSVKTIGEIKVKELSDGSKAMARPFSTKDGRPTLQINHANGTKTEIRYNQ